MDLKLKEEYLNHLKAAYEIREQFKDEYNKLLEREKKAEQYLKTCSEENLEKWTPNLLAIMEEMSKYIKLIGMTDNEAFNGFH